MTKICTILLLLFSFWPTTAFAQATDAPETVDFVLDWVPNTNHTGIFVAEELGYFEEAGVAVNVQRPPQGSVTELIGLGNAPFGISFQDTMAHRLAGGLPITAVATILEHNTSGIISAEAANIQEPTDLAGHSYGTWNDPIEQGMLRYIIESEGGNFSDIQLIPNQADNSVVGLATEQFDSAWVYYAWDGFLADSLDVPTNFFYFRDYAEELDFYSPVIIANNDYLKANPEEAKAVIQAIKKGYQYAMEHPEEAADILLKHAPELEDQRDMVHASQAWISEQYASDPSQWGHIDEARWNAFYQWLWDKDLVEADLTQESHFTNEFLGD